MAQVRSANTETGEVQVGKLTIVDLAGAELAMQVRKGKKGEEAGAEGGGADEPKQNASLAALVRVIDALGEGGKSSKAKAKTIDFEASKLTELLQDCLGGNSKSMMFVCVDPVLGNAPLSGTCLQFAQKAREVKLGAASRNKESMHTAMHKVNTTMSALTQHAGNLTNRGKG